MKKLLTILCLTCALALVAQARPDKNTEAKHRTKPTAEQKAARKALVEKYDADKSGRLSKEELSKATKEELAKAGLDQKRLEHKKAKKH